MAEGERRQLAASGYRNQTNLIPDRNGADGSGCHGAQLRRTNGRRNGGHGRDGGWGSRVSLGQRVNSAGKNQQSSRQQHSAQMGKHANPQIPDREMLGGKV